MKDEIKDFVLSAVLVLCVIAFFALMTYRGPDVRMTRVNDSLYARVQNGFIGMNCYNEKGERIVAPSHFLDSGWVVYVPDIGAYPLGYTFRISCMPYYAYRGPWVTASYTQNSCILPTANMCTIQDMNSCVIR